MGATGPGRQGLLIIVTYLQLMRKVEINSGLAAGAIVLLSRVVELVKMGHIICVMSYQAQAVDLRTVLRY